MDEIDVDPEVLARQLATLERKRIFEEEMAARGLYEIPVRMWRGKQIIDPDSEGEIVGYVWGKKP